MNMELKELVKQEADNLLIHATQEERDKLNPSLLISTHTKYCIYGQMTGNCFSARAKELLNLCTVPYSFEYGYFEKSSQLVFTTENRDYSPIEFYIAQEGANNEGLISYLKGHTKELSL